MSYYRQQLEDWLGELDVKAQYVVDIGGKQKPVKGRTKTWEVEDYVIHDLPEFDVEKHRAFNEADVIFCLEVFEYLINPLEALKNIRLTLKYGGRAYITFAGVYPLHEEVELDSLRYTESGIRRLANAVGLSINEIWYRVDRSGLLQQMYHADGMHPAKGYAHHDATGFIVEMVKI